jgi:hypothetical protein
MCKRNRGLGRGDQRRTTNGELIQVCYTLTLVERSVKNPGTLLWDRTLAKQNSSVFNQLPRFRLERVFGRRTRILNHELI